MNPQKRTSQQRAADLVIIEEKHLRGWRSQEIADFIASQRPYRITRQQVSYDLKKLERLWLAKATESIEQAKARSIRILEEQKRELWAAWEKSKQDATIKMAETGEGSGAGKGGRKQRVTVEGQCGEVAYMRLITDIEKRIAELRGLNAPVQQECQVLGNPAAPLTIEFEHNGKEIVGQ